MAHLLMAVHFAHGFNDVFHAYAAGADKTIAFQRAREPWSSHIRFPVSWTDVQQWGASSYHWKPVPGDLHYPGYDYEATRAESNSRELRSLPIVLGCPTGWIPRAHRAPCVPSLEGSVAEWEQGWYPTSTWAIDQFANFCVETLKYFDACQRVEAVEIWNEPNLPANLGNPVQAKASIQIADPTAYGQILAAVIAKVNAANANSYFSRPMSVVSGGIYMDSNGAWKNYLSGFKNQAAPYGVGIHPYDTRDHFGAGSSDAAADAVVDRIKDLYEQASNEATQDLWVTETGASSRQPFNQAGQSRAIRKLAGRASNGGWFDTRARCKAVLIHRLYPNDEDPGESEAPNTQFHKFSMVNKDPTWSVKTAWNTLVAEWGP